MVLWNIRVSSNTDPILDEPIGHFSTTGQGATRLHQFETRKCVAAIFRPARRVHKVSNHGEIQPS